MFGLGMPELIVILIVLLLLFGAARLPELGRSLGKTISEIKRGMKEISEEPKASTGPSTSSGPVESEEKK